MSLPSPTNSNGVPLPPSKMKIATINTRTLNDSHLDHFLAELEQIKWQIVGLSETKLHERSKTIEKTGMLYLIPEIVKGKRKMEWVSWFTAPILKT